MPKITASAKEARRTQILDAAVRCFARRGYHATTIEDIVAESGLSRGALYLYYPSKEALYLALSERWSCGLEAALRQQLTPGLAPSVVLQKLLEVTGAYVQAEAEACRVLMDGWTLGQDIPALGEQVRHQQEQVLLVFQQILQAGVMRGEFRANLQLETQARLLLATLHGLMVQWHIQPGSIDWQQVSKEVLQGLQRQRA